MRSTDVLPREYVELQLRFADWLAFGNTRSENFDQSRLCRSEWTLSIDRIS